MANNCMYCLPHELTGIGKVCGLLNTTCNDLGKQCVVYRAHTKESRKALAEAIEIKRKEIKNG